MKIDAPAASQIHQLRQLWKLAFGDEDAFIDMFFDNGFALERCRCLTAENQIAAALYWFETECDGQKLAYLYGVATHPEHRGKGLCHQLMMDTHSHLAALGYSGIVLVPQKEGLREMYRKMGYQTCSAVDEFFCTDDPYPAPMHLIDSSEYAALRKHYLPPHSVIQEGSNLTFLNAYAKFYKGMDFIMVSTWEADSLFALEYLGNRESAPGVLCSLGFSQGTFRTIGSKKPFAMFCPLRSDAVTPGYFGFAFD